MVSLFGGVRDVFLCLPSDTNHKVSSSEKTSPLGIVAVEQRKSILEGYDYATSDLAIKY